MIEYTSLHPVTLFYLRNKIEGTKVYDTIELKPSKQGDLVSVEYPACIEKWIWDQSKNSTIIKNGQIIFKILGFIRSKKYNPEQKLKSHGNLWKS
jgi:hypothetical protein